MLYYCATCCPTSLEQIEVVDFGPQAGDPSSALADHSSSRPWTAAAAAADDVGQEVTLTLAS